MHHSFYYPNDICFHIYISASFDSCSLSHPGRAGAPPIYSWLYNVVEIHSYISEIGGTIKCHRSLSELSAFYFQLLSYSKSHFHPVSLTCGSVHLLVSGLYCLTRTGPLGSWFQNKQTVALGESSVKEKGRWLPLCKISRIIRHNHRATRSLMETFDSLLLQDIKSLSGPELRVLPVWRLTTVSGPSIPRAHVPQHVLRYCPPTVLRGLLHPPSPRGLLPVLGPGLQVLQRVQGGVVRAQRVGRRGFAEGLVEGGLLQLQDQPIGLLALRLPLLRCLPPAGDTRRMRMDTKETEPQKTELEEDRTRLKERTATR